MHSLLSSTPRNYTIQQKVKYRLGQVGTKLLGAVAPEHQAELPREYDFDAHVFHSQFASTHYGIMIPDLPEPYRYLSYASVIGDVGAKITKVSPKLTDLAPENTATLVHGTALSETKDAYKIYDIQHQLKFQQSPFRIDFAEDSSLYEEDGNYRLVSNLADLKADLTLTPTDALTWFAHSSLYQHFSVLMKYSGTLTQQGKTIEISGLCTLEHWKAISVSMLPKQLLTHNLTLPLSSFSYQVINLNAEEQLVLAFISFAGEPAYTAVSYRHVDGTSIQYDQADFEVIALKTDPLITPDGYVMEVPQSFRWVVSHEGEKVLDLIAVVDTPYCYGLAAGYVTSYQWIGEFKRQKAEGRGYLEFIDRR